MSRSFQRIIVIVLDSVGIGELPDAAAYGDVGSNTLGHVVLATGVELPNLVGLGLGRLVPELSGHQQVPPRGAWGRMAEQSQGKDSTTGHWEIAGIVLDTAFPTYPDGFPAAVLDPFVAAIGRPVLGNKAASGTVIIEELGARHLDSGQPIVYTSADSVFQIAAHEEVVPVPQLYRWCEIARRQLVGDHGVGRVIARPFVGEPGSFTRTGNRRDFSRRPPDGQLLQRLQQAGLVVHSIGKIWDLFAGAHIDHATKTASNREGIDATRRWIDSGAGDFLFVNLVDFDQLYGHRNKPEGYAAALVEFDEALPALEQALQPEDLLIITADHGNDPTTPSTDHSREYVPLLAIASSLSPVELGTRSSFADLGQTVAENFGTRVPSGTSFLAELS